MNWAVPMNRANRSESRPNASGSTLGRLISARRTSRGWSSRGVRPRGSRATTARLGLLALGLGGGRRARPRLLRPWVPQRLRGLAPVGGQDVVEHVVDGDGAEQVAVDVRDRHPDQVVGGEEPGDL